MKLVLAQNHGDVDPCKSCVLLERGGFCHCVSNNNNDDDDDDDNNDNDNDNDNIIMTLFTS